MDQATFQWLAGIAIAIIIGLITWIARDTYDRIKDASEDIDKLGGRLDKKLEAMTAEDRSIRDSTDAKVEKLYAKLDAQAKEIADLRETVAGFQASFMTRDEHARYCAQQHHQNRV